MAGRLSTHLDGRFPTNIVFKENPGGEFRKSYHGYPSGYAQLLYSPTQWSVEPMQIDTHNREYDINDSEGYRPAFLPDADHNNMTNLHSGLSPLIECPCSDRITRRLVKESAVLTTGSCATPMASQSECAAAVAAVATLASSVSVNNASLPPGCIIVPNQGVGTYNAVFNTAPSHQTCAIDGGRGAFTWKGPISGAAINCVDGGNCLPSDKRYGCTGEFKGQCTWDSPAEAQANCGNYQECQGFMCSSAYASKMLCFGRGTETTTVSANAQSWIKEYAVTSELRGQTSLLQGAINLTVSHNGTTAKITMSGADGAWFGVGFNAAAMKDLPYAIIVDGTGVATERRLVDHGPGALLKPSITTLSSSVSAGVRTVVLSRPVAAATPLHYALPTVPKEINIITAMGSTPQLAYHKARTAGSITLVPTGISACMCQPTSTAYLTYMNTSTEMFHYDCLDEPRSDMLRHGDGTGRALPNAACQMETYHGGLRCCQHHFFLTDMDQASLIPNKTDTYFLKWRYYFQVM